MGKMAFSENEHFFHLDEKLLSMKKEIKDTIDKDLLELKKPRWIPAVSVERQHSMDHHKHLFNVPSANPYADPYWFGGPIHHPTQEAQHVQRLR